MYSDKKTFFATRGLQRFLYLDLWMKIILIVAVLAMLTAFFLSVTHLRTDDSVGRLDALMFGAVHAQELPDIGAEVANVPSPVPEQGEDFKRYVRPGIIVVLAIVFLWSLFVTFHSTNDGSVAVATDVVKVLLGFFVAISQGFMGL